MFVVYHLLTVVRHLYLVVISPTIPSENGVVDWTSEVPELSFIGDGPVP